MVDAIVQARGLLADARRAVSFSGAGLSAESGIPTFRDAPSGGLWDKFDPMRLASPEGFAEDPRLVMDWYTWRRQRIGESEPNPAHVALSRQDGMVHVTQNVDDLLDRVGARDVVQLHGSIARDRCHAWCGFEEPVDLAAPPPLRDCPQCGAQVRPSVVWFGEALPPDAWEAAESACRNCDVLLVVGTSAVVYPAAGLISVARASGAAIIIVNTQPSDASGLADVEVLGPAGEIIPQLFAT